MPPPLTADAAVEKRRSILRSARLVAEQNGLEAAKMSDIAREARVSKGTLYRFFESKEDLLVAMVIEGASELIPALESVRSSEGTPRDRLARVVGLLTDVYPVSIDRVVVDVQALGVAARDPVARARLESTNREIYRALHDQIALLLVEGMQSGDFRADLDIDASASAFIATRDGITYRASFDPDRRAPRRMHDALAILVDGVTYRKS